MKKLLTNKLGLLSLLTFLIALTTHARIAHGTEVCLTIDDLPIMGPQPRHTTRTQIADDILATLRKHHIEGTYGFTNAFTAHDVPLAYQILRNWVSNGQLLANHTYSHLSLNRVGARRYIEDIQKNEPILKDVMGDKNYKYFRYPYLNLGRGNAYTQVKDFLSANHYIVAPVSIDLDDWLWNISYVRCSNGSNVKTSSAIKNDFINLASRALEVARISARYAVHREIRYILLLHINQLTADTLDAILTNYENNGVKFISLHDALMDPVYSNPGVFRAYDYVFDIQLLRKSRSLGKQYRRVCRTSKTYPNLGAQFFWRDCGRKIV